jgi:uncharacterized iron-regulated membrane protein
MAVTGSLYLYKSEIERSLYADLVMSQAPSSPLPIGDMIDRVERQTGGRVTQISRPAAADESWRITVRNPAGEDRLAFIRPDNGFVLGTSGVGGPMELVKRLHSLTVAGPAGNLLVEVVAGWAVVLVLTGIYLWWPRGANRALSLAGRVGERRFRRNLHASVGVLAGAVILFLAVTGMPWTIFWGANFHALVATQQIGRPAPPQAQASPGHDDHLPWTLRGAHPPMATAEGDVGPERAIASAAGQGFTAPWILDLPSTAGTPYRLTAAAESTKAVRVIYVSPTSGAVLQDVGYADFGAGAKLFEWGIYTHQGRQFGELNRLAMLGGCAALLLLTMSAPILWWRRRRGGRLKGPPIPEDPARARGFVGMMLVIGLLFPLTGATMLAALAASAVCRFATRQNADATFEVPI